MRLACVRTVVAAPSLVASKMGIMKSRFKFKGKKLNVPICTFNAGAIGVADAPSRRNTLTRASVWGKQFSADGEGAIHCKPSTEGTDRYRQLSRSWSTMIPWHRSP